MNDLIERPSLAKICQLQAAFQTLPQFDCPVQHHFAPGVYLRELFMPAGISLVGKMHATEHFLIVASGDVTIINGEARDRIQGPRVLLTTPGTKRAIFAHADTTLITVHPTDETDLDTIESNIILPDPVELLEETK